MKTKEQIMQMLCDAQVEHEERRQQEWGGVLLRPSAAGPATPVTIEAVAEVLAKLLQES